MLSIKLDKESYRAGETINVSVGLKLQKPVKIRGLTVELACYEKLKVKDTRVMDEYDYARKRELGLSPTTNLTTTITEEDERLFYQKREFSGGEYCDEVFDAAFTLPPDAPPTSLEFGHDDKTFAWKVFAKLDVPFALDENAEADVFVEGL